MFRGNVRANPVYKSVVLYKPLAAATLNRGDGIRILITGKRRESTLPPEYMSALYHIL